MGTHKLINGNPHWRNVQTLAIYFQLIDEATAGSAKVNMDRPGCNLEENLCGTPACHAGWFGTFYDNSSPYYSAYADKMSNLLGFNNMYRLEEWAARKPSLWGNENGEGMFCENEAFGLLEGDIVTLKHIYKHWYKVAARLYKLQGGI